MKKSKILAPALAILCLSTAASVTGTVAWFAANNTVTATGMTINASAPASIVISKDVLPSASTTGISVSFADTGVHTISPCTYVSSLETNPKLGAPTIEGSKIDKTTGLPKLEADYTSMEYAAVAATGYYYHAIVYIATAPHTASISSGKKLTVGLSYGGEVAPITTLLSGSVSYFVNYAYDVAHDVVGSYVGTLNLAGKDRSLNQATNLTPNSLDLYTASVATPIPNADSATGVRIDMYAYFDGALLSSYDAAVYANNSAYVNTDTLNVAQLIMNSTFDCVTA